jgi:hypothetical protein
MVILNILHSFGIFYDHLVHFSGFGIAHQEKSGNSADGTAKGAFNGILVTDRQNVDI